MYTPETHSPMPKARSSRAECCAEVACESGLRNNYFDGKRLTTDSFRVEQRYLLERRQLLNRAIHGWGVVYGYPVTSSAIGEFSIGPGLAFDKPGRELIQVENRQIGPKDLLLFDEKSDRTDLDRAMAEARRVGIRPGEASIRICWLLSVHYAEQKEGQVDVKDPCSCEHREWDRTCETVHYSLRQVPCDKCCEDINCELTCGCGSGRCCEEPAATTPESVPTKDEPSRASLGKPVRRGGCRCLCDYLTSQSFTEHGHLREIEGPCGSIWVDPAHGVPLACVYLVYDPRLGWKFEVDPCGPRRLVKRNDLLFDLIRGCDLTRISKIGWEQWHRDQQPLVSFPDFSAALGPPGRQEVEYVTNDFWVRFSRPVREETLRPDCFAMTVMSVEREGGWREIRRVPIVRIATKQEKDDPDGHVSEARIVVEGSWLEDGVRGRRSLFLGGETWVEVEVRGDFIIDCNGQAVDANAVGLSPFPTGNGTPGGTFVSSFRVAAAREAPERRGVSS
jgi:hypothetical protein